MAINGSEKLNKFIIGFRDEMPILIGVFPFGMLYAILARGIGLSSIEVQAMSLFVFAGSSQLMLIQLAELKSPILMMIMTGFIINLRHILYSASISPYTKKLSSIWKYSLSYLLTDEAYAVAISNYSKNKNDYNHWYFLGAGIALWSTWQLSTLIGFLVGSRIPENWSLNFTLPLTFIALLVPMVKDRPGIIAALVAGFLALVTIGAPYNLGLIVASLIGIIAGLWSEKP